jgi:hypothetical protein
MSKKENFIVLGIIGFMGVLGILNIVDYRVHANFHTPFPSAVCGKGLHIGNPHCSPHPSQTASPTAIPSGTPIPSSTPEPSVEPSSTPKPTQTPEPSSQASASGQGFSSPQGPFGAPSAPVCDLITAAPSVIAFSRNNPSSIHIVWTPSDPFVHDFVVRYSLGPDIWLWSTVVHVEPGQKLETDLNLLPLNHMIWVKVAGTENGCVGPFGNAIDP